MSENFNLAAKEAENMTRTFIRSRMDDLDVTVYRLSKLTELQESTIHRWLNGETNISFNNCLKILGALEIRPYLIPAEDDDI